MNKKNNNKKILFTLIVILIPSFLISRFSEIKNINQSNVLLANEKSYASASHHFKANFVAENMKSIDFHILEKERSKNVKEKKETYNYTFNFKQFLDEYFIGDWTKNNLFKKVIFDFKKSSTPIGVAHSETKHEILGAFQKETYDKFDGSIAGTVNGIVSIFSAPDVLQTKYYDSWLFGGFTDQGGSYDPNKNIDPNGSYKFEFKNNPYTYGKIKSFTTEDLGKDHEYVKHAKSTKIKWENTNIIVSIDHKIIGLNDNELWKGVTWMKASYDKIKHSITVETDIILPYSWNDLNNFNSLFKNIFSKSIVLENVSNPVVADFSLSGENWINVKKEFDRRKQKFYNSHTILNNRIGFLSKPSNNPDFPYVRDEDVSDIEIINVNNKLGIAGTIEVDAKFYLKNNRKFYFNKKEASNSITVSFKIIPKLSLDIDYSIDKLIQINPYISASNSRNDIHYKKTNQNIILGSNYPVTNVISDFNVNINYINEIGQYNIFPYEKLPVISKHGSIITIKLKIKLNDIILDETITFKRVYGNGEIKATLILNSPQYHSSAIKIKGNAIKLAIKANGDQINVYNDAKIILISNTEIKDCSIKIYEIDYTIAHEQTSTQSKWARLKDEAVDFVNKSTNKQIRYVGHFETFDPFIFNMIAQKIRVFDPITGHAIGYASKYKPFIVEGLSKYALKGNGQQTNSSKEEAIFPKPEQQDNDQSFYEANLGTYVMTKKTQSGNFSFHIIVREYDENSTNENKYTIDRWIIDVSMNLLNSKAEFKMTGYSGNELIKKENDEKYFNKEALHYRGGFANPDTGMYIPKIVWVNAYPPESFLYDPLDENGQLIIKKNATEQQKEDAKYDIGYIAELNATAFTKGDYSSLPTFGGYEANFDVNVFKPTGLMPYSESYTYNQYDLVPKAERSPLSQSGLQTINAKDDFRQFVMKRPESNNYLYQFVKIAKTDINNNISDVDKYGADIIAMYGDKKGLHNKPLFVDFWQTHHGKNLINYLVNDYKIFKNEADVKALSYNDIIQYWSIYVNDPSNYDNVPVAKQFDISKLDFGYETISLSNKIAIKNKIIDIITQKINELVDLNGWSNDNVFLQYNKHFLLEASEEMFDTKIDTMLEQYNLPLDKAQIVDIKIIILEEKFKNLLKVLSGTNTINFLNNKDVDKIIDLSKYGNNTLKINTNQTEIFSKDNTIADVKRYILSSIDRDFQKILKDVSFLSNDFFPKLNKDYKLTFFTKYYDQSMEKIKQFTTIEQAINDVILYNVDKKTFNNNLFIKVEAIFDDQSHFFKNSYLKVVNNASLNKIMHLDSFDLSSINNYIYKINTQDQTFKIEQNYNKQTQLMKNIKQKIKQIIDINSRTWQNSYNQSLILETHYDFKFIKHKHDNGVVEYYDNFLQAINSVLLKDVDNDEFDNTLEIEVYAPFNDNNLFTKGFFIFKINNSHLNENLDFIENRSEIILDKNITNTILDSNNIINNENDLINNNSKEDIKNKLSNETEDLYWWILSPTFLFIFIVAMFVIVIRIRRNRKIR